MTTPPVCLLIRPVGTPAEDARFHYCDPSLSTEEQEAIRAQSDYPDAPIRDLQGNPIAIFRYAPLPSGRLALSRLLPRQDTVVMHTLVMNPGEIPGHPLDHHQWPGWCDNPETFTPSPPALEPRPPHLDESRTFLTASPDREAAAVFLLAGLLSRDRHRRSLLVRDLPTRGLAWMICIQRMLPVPHARHLALSSHQASEGQSRPWLAATDPDSPLDYRRVQQGDAFYIIDLPGRQRSTLPPHDPLVETARDCASQLVSWLLEEPGQLLAFQDFVTRLFVHEALTPELWWMMRLYQASNEPSASLQGFEVESVLDILRYYTHPASWEGVLGLLNSLRPQLIQNQRFSDDDTLLGLFLEASQQSGQPDPQRRAFQQWLLLFDRYLLNGEQADSLLERYREVASLPLAAELHEQMLDPARLTRVETQIPALAPSPLGAAGWLLLDSLLQLGRPLEGHRQWLDPLLAGLLAEAEGQSQFTWLLTRAGQAPTVAALLHRAWAATRRLDGETATAQAALGRLLGAHLRDSGEAMALRQALLDNHDEALLVAEWRCQLATSEDSRALFHSYRRGVLDPLPDYRDRSFGTVCAALFEVLPDSGRQQQAREWLFGPEEDWWRLPDHLAGDCVSLVNQQLDLQDQSAATRQLSDRLFARAKELGRLLQPDKPQLRRSLDYATRGELQGDDDWFRDTHRALQGLGETDYRRFLDGILGTLLLRSLSPEEHRRVLQDLDNGQGGLLGECYLSALSRLLERQEPLATAVALRFWMGPHRETDQPPREAVLERFYRGLSRWANTPLANLYRVLEQALSDSERLTPEWREFWRTLDQQRQQTQGSLGRLLRSTMGNLVSHKG